MSLGGDNILGRGTERWKGVGVGMDDSPVWLLTYDVSLSLHEESGFEDRNEIMYGWYPGHGGPWLLLLWTGLSNSCHILECGLRTMCGKH